MLLALAASLALPALVPARAAGPIDIDLTEPCGDLGFRGRARRGSEEVAFESCQSGQAVVVRLRERAGRVLVEYRYDLETGDGSMVLDGIEVAEARSLSRSEEKRILRVQAHPAAPLFLAVPDFIEGPGIPPASAPAAADSGALIVFSFE